MANRSSTTRLLERLVRVPSVNPLLSTGPGCDEQALGKVVAEELARSGAEVSCQPVRDGRFNVIGRLERRGRADDQTILLTAHMDTYPAKGPRSDCNPVIEGGRLYGRGSADAKGPLASMIAAFADAAAAPSRRETYLVATVDEECLLLGAYALAELGLHPALAITGEPTRLAPVVGQKGIIRGAISVAGPAAHAAYPGDDSALQRLGKVIAAVDSINQDFVDVAGELGPATLSMTTVEADGGMNLIAQNVRLHFDGRFLPGTTGDNFAAQIEAALRDRLEGIDFSMEPLAFVSPANAAAVDPLLEEFFGHVADVAGTCVPETFSYGSEAGVLSTFSDAAVVFGPGNPEYSHAETESIELDELDTAREILYRLIVGQPERTPR